MSLNYVVFLNDQRKYLRSYLPTDTVEEYYNGLGFYVYDSLPDEIKNLKDNEDAMIGEDGTITIVEKPPIPPKPPTPEEEIAQLKQSIAELSILIAAQ